jgi:hypothetical protein
VSNTSTKPAPVIAAIQAALGVLFTPDDVIELRAIAKGGKKRTDAGYFDSAHWPELADHAAALSNGGFAVYITLNPVDPQLLGRYNNRIEQYATATTTDKQSVRRRWLLIDLDPVRPANTSATETQLAAAKQRATVIYKHLQAIGWADPVVAKSGNGYHLLYAIDLPNDDESTALIKGILLALADQFDDAQIKVDRSVFNAARICKLYGTVANKGDHTDAAPWRLSELIKTPVRGLVSNDQLRLVQPPAPAIQPRPSAGTRFAATFNLEDFLTRHGLAYTDDQHSGRERFKLAICPFNAEHINGEAAVFRDATGALGFKCMHDSCSGKNWAALREHLDGPRLQRDKSGNWPEWDDATESVATHGIDLGANGQFDQWPELQPLIVQIDAQEYPLDALPDAVRCAVQEVAGFVKAPIPLIATSALAALSLAIQAHTDVQRAEKLHGPCGLFLLAIADSGERKSTCDSFFTTAIRDYQAREQEAAKPIMRAYKSEHDAWEAQRSGLREKIKSLAKDGKPCTALVGQLHDLDAGEPIAPRVPRLIYGDATPEALTFALAKQWPSGGVISSEAGTVFGGHGMGGDSVMRNLAALNQLWDGATLNTERRSSESFTVRGARLTMALQVQEATIRAFFDSTKGLARGTGFLARFLVSWPQSTQGTRHFTEAPANWPALAAFNNRLTALLNRHVPLDDDGGLSPAMLTLAPDAKAAWVEFHNQIEAELSTGRELYDVRDVASKTADNAARLAALFHTFTGSIGPIDIEAMESAARVTIWHLTEAKRFLGELAMPTELANPMRLETWMLDYCKRKNTDKVPTREVQRGGPSGMRDKKSCTEAVKELADLGRARLVQDGKKRAIQINPALLVAAS